MAAALAFDADIRAEPDDRPLIGAAWMWFAQTDEVLELKVGEHCSVFGTLNSVFSLQ
jgi:hypothetical protein